MSAHPDRLRHGRYAILRQLGAGGEGRVFLAQDRVEQRPVVLKWALRRALGEDAALFEHRMLARRPHPHLARVEDVYFEPALGGWVLVESWIPGRDLVVAGPDLDLAELERIGWQLVDALSWLHASGLRHGDVKPANVLVHHEDERVHARLIDFGLAAPADEPELPGATPAFLAPEIAAASPPTAAIDWWALGEALRRTLARRHPGPVLALLLDACLLRDPEARSRAVEGLRRRRDGPLTLPERLPLPQPASADPLLDAIHRAHATGIPVVHLVGAVGSGRRSRLEAVELELRLARREVVRLERSFGARELELRLATELGVVLRLGEDLADADELRTPAPRTGLEILGRRPELRPLTILLAPAAAACSAGLRLVAALRDLAAAPGAARRDAMAVAVVADDAGHGAANEPRIDQPLLTVDDVEDLLALVAPPAADEARPARVGLARLLHDLSGGRIVRLERLLRLAVAEDAIGFTEGRLRRDERALRRAARSFEGATATVAPRAAPVLEALRRNLGMLDADGLAACTGLETAAVEERLRVLFEAGLVVAVPAAGQPAMATESSPGAAADRSPVQGGDAADAISDAAAAWVWAPSAPAADEERWRERGPALIERLRAWIEGPSPEAFVAHVARASRDFQLIGATPDLVEPLVRALVATGDAARAEAVVAAAMTRAPGHAALARSKAALASLRGRNDEAAADLEAALAAPAREPIAEGAGASTAGARTRSERAALLAQLAHVELLRGRAEEARARASESLDAPDLAPTTRARALTMRASAAVRLEDVAAARADFRLALELWGELGRSDAEAACLGNLGVLERASGDTGAAERHLRAAVARLEVTGAPDQLAGALTNLGVVLAEQDRHEEARSAHGRAALLFRLQGDAQRAAAAIASRGIASWRGGAPMPALRDLAAAEPILARGRDLRALLLALEHREAIELVLGRRRARARTRERARRALAGAPVGPERERAESLWRDAGADGVAWRRPLAKPSASSRSSSRSSATPRAYATIASWMAARDRVVELARDGDLDGSRAAFRALERMVQHAEQEMSRRQRTVFRALVVDPTYEALRDDVAALLGGRGGESGTLRDLLRAVHAAESLEAALGAVAEASLRLTPAVRCFVIRPESSGELRFLASAGAGSDAHEISTLAVRDALQAQRPVVVADAGSDQRLGFAASVRKLGLVSVACLPIRIDDRVFALLYLDTPLERGAFDEDVIDTLAALADLSATALSLFLRATRKASEARKLRDEITSRDRELQSRSHELERARDRLGRGIIVGKSPPIRALNAMIEKTAPTDLSVLILGETGTGKELVAEALHARSSRRGGPFIAVNVAALPRTLAESELFGHEKGAFTGATTKEPGLFLLAHRGTLFLDEIGELDPDLQAKLLRALETGRVRAVGGRTEKKFDVRVVAATNRDARHDPSFRQDLFFRLAKIELEIPPLRERADDIPLLIEELSRRANAPAPRLEAAALDALLAHAWPGNVRELGNLVDRLRVLKAPGEPVGLDDLPEDVRNAPRRTPPPLEETIAEAVRRAMTWAGGNKLKAAEALGISRTTLYKRLAADAEWGGGDA